MSKKIEHTRQERLSAALKYWAEPETVYYAKEVKLWCHDKDVIADDKKSVGYLPVYEHKEDAEAAHPGMEISEMMLVGVPEQ